jgi:hypothetical protein
MQAQQRRFLNVIGLSKSLGIIRDGDVNKNTNPRQIETTTAAYHVEIQAKLHKTRPKSNSSPHQQQQQPALSQPKQPSARSVYSKPKNINGLKIHSSRMHK